MLTLVCHPIMLFGSSEPVHFNRAAISVRSSVHVQCAQDTADITASVCFFCECLTQAIFFPRCCLSEYVSKDDYVLAIFLMVGSEISYIKGL